MAKKVSNIFDINGILLKSSQTLERVDKSKKLGLHYPFEVVSLPSKDALWLSVGMTPEGPALLNMTNSPHVLIGGAAGSGKTKVLDSMICNLLETYTLDELKIYYLDGNWMAAGKYWSGLTQLDYISGLKKSFDCLYDLEKEVKRRISLISSKSVQTLHDYNINVVESERLPFILVVIDELYELEYGFKKFENIEANQKKENLCDCLTRLLSSASSVGIYMVATTQRVSNNIIPLEMKAFFETRLGLRYSLEQESYALIGAEGLELLRSSDKGKGMLSYNGLVDFQAYTLQDNIVFSIIKKHKEISI